MLSAHFPNATFIGLDVDNKMIEFARQTHAQQPKFHFHCQDITVDWSEWPQEITTYGGRVDAIFSNFALHWTYPAYGPLAVNCNHLLTSNGGVLICNLIYNGDIAQVASNEQEKQWLLDNIDYPSEQEYVSKFMFGFRDAGFREFNMDYDEPRTLYETSVYDGKQWNWLFMNSTFMFFLDFIQIPINWYVRLYSSNSDHALLTSKVRELLMKIRIQRSFTREDDGTAMVEIKQNLWTFSIVKR